MSRSIRNKAHNPRQKRPDIGSMPVCREWRGWQPHLQGAGIRAKSAAHSPTRFSRLRESSIEVKRAKNTYSISCFRILLGLCQLPARPKKNINPYNCHSVSFICHFAVRVIFTRASRSGSPGCKSRPKHKISRNHPDLFRMKSKLDCSNSSTNYRGVRSCLGWSQG